MSDLIVEPRQAIPKTQPGGPLKRRRTNERVPHFPLAAVQPLTPVVSYSQATASFLRALKPPRPSLKPPVGQKWKLHVDNAAYGLPDDVKLSALITPDNRKFYVTSTETQGSYKKCRLAIDAETGEVFADLESRLSDKGGKSKWDDDRTLSTSLEGIVTEAEQTQALTRIKIEDFVFVERDGTHGTERKAHVLQTLMAGSASVFVKAIDGSWDKDETRSRRRAVGHWLAHELARQMAGLHRKNMIHRDVKLANTLVRADGEIVLADFDFMRELDAQGSYRGVRLGSYPAPEVWEGKRYGRPVDVWMLGVTLASIYVNTSAFGNARFNPYDFEDWRSNLFTNGDIDWEKMNGDTNDFSCAFRRFRRKEPVVCDYVLKNMLDPDPASRATAEEVLQKTRDWANDETETLARATLSEVVKRTRQHDLVTAMKRYQNAHAATRR